MDTFHLFDDYADRSIDFLLYRPLKAASRLWLLCLHHVEAHRLSSVVSSVEPSWV